MRIRVVACPLFALGCLLVGCGGTTGSPSDAGTADVVFLNDAGDRVDASRADGAIDASGGCHENNECHGLQCLRAEERLCGGPAPMRECAKDADCADAGASFVCVDRGCGATACAPRCKDDTACQTTPAGAAVCSKTSGKCEAKPCTQASECPVNYACAQGLCAPKMCTSDAECSFACVNRICSASLGRCVAPPP